MDWFLVGLKGACKIKNCLAWEKGARNDMENTTEKPRQVMKGKGRNGRMSFFDHLACGFGGAVFGALYGVMLAGVLWSKSLWADFFLDWRIVAVSAGIFGVLGVLTGSFVGELMADMLYLLFQTKSEPMHLAAPKGIMFLRTLLVLIVGAGIVMWWPV